MSIFTSNDDFYTAKQINEKITGLETKSKESGISYSILKQVYDRGMAAWKTGHRPGTTSQQWAFARVNSFITKGSGTWGKADKDLASKVKKEDISESNFKGLSNKDANNPMKFHKVGKPAVAYVKNTDKDAMGDIIFYTDGKNVIVASGNRQDGYGQGTSQADLIIDFEPLNGNLKTFASNWVKKNGRNYNIKLDKVSDKARKFSNKGADNGNTPRGMSTMNVRVKEDVKEADSDYMKGVANDKKDDRKAQFDKQAKMDDNDPNAYKPAPGDKDKDGEMKKTKLSKHTKAYNAKFGKKESVKSVFTGEVNIFAEAKIRFRNERDVEKHKQNLLMAMEIAVEAEGDYTGAMKQIEKLERGLSKNPSVMAALKFYAEDVEFPQDIADELQEKNPGLWANIHAKRKRIKAGSGEKMKKKGDKGAPKELPEEDMIEGRYTKYSDLLMQRARIIGDKGKVAMDGNNQEMKKIDRLIAKELKKLGVSDAAG